MRRSMEVCAICRRFTLHAWVGDDRAECPFCKTVTHYPDSGEEEQDDTLDPTEDSEP